MLFALLGLDLNGAEVEVETKPRNTTSHCSTIQHTTPHHTAKHHNRPHYTRSSTACSPRAVWQCTEGVPLSAAPGQCRQKEFYCQRAVLYTASLHVGSGQWDCFCALPHYPGAVGSRTPFAQYLTAWGQWAVELFLCTAALPWGSG